MLFAIEVTVFDTERNGSIENYFLYFIRTDFMLNIHQTVQFLEYMVY